MAYLEGFENDVFISYTHVDDLPDRPDVAGERGWVERFASRLKVALWKRMGEEVAVWRDPELKRSDRFDDRIEAAVRGSAILLTLISRRYLKSDYCLQEIDWFVDAAGAGLGVGTQSRVLPVLLYNLPFDEWPQACHGLSGFPFCDAIGTQLGRPLDPDGDDRRFDVEFRRLVDEIGDLLDALKARQPPAEPAAAPAAPGFCVYLAATSDHLAGEKGRLAQALRAAGVEVLGHAPPIPPPYPRADHAEAGRRAVERAGLSVHLLDHFAGAPLDGAVEITYPQEQARISLEHGQAQLVILPEFFNLDEVEESEHREFLRGLQEGDFPVGSHGRALEVAKARTGQTLELILERRRRHEEQEAARSDAGSVFLDLHPRDLATIGGLVEFLGERRLTAVTMPSADLSPSTGDKLFEQNLTLSRALLIVFGRVGRDWVKARLERALQLIVRHDLPFRPAVWATPPAKSADELRFPFCEVVDSTTRFDPAQILPLLPTLPESPR